MKERYRVWENLTSSKPPSVVVRLIDLPGMRDLEARKLMNDRARVDDDRDQDLLHRITEFSVKHFGINEWDTRFQFPEDFDQIERDHPYRAYDIEDERDDHERHFLNGNIPVQDHCSYLRHHGIDLTDDNGQPIRLFDRFVRQAEAAIHHICGARMPDMEAVRNSNWEAALAESAQQHMKRKARG
jgi:hypothetical protein